MTAEDQVCSLDLAKRLKALGVKQASLYHRQPWLYEMTRMVVVAEGAEVWSDDCESYSAFTVAELREMLPRHFTFFTKRRYPDYLEGSWFCAWMGNQNFFADTEADAAPKKCSSTLSRTSL